MKEMLFVSMLALALALGGCGDGDGGGGGDSDTDTDTDTDTGTDTGTGSDTETDTGTGAGLSCVGDLGGVCTTEYFDICPVDYQPYGDLEPLDCSYLCCVPTSTAWSCNADASYNCVLGSACPECWMPAASDLSCPSDRVCCYYACD